MRLALLSLALSTFVAACAGDTARCDVVTGGGTVRICGNAFVYDDELDGIRVGTLGDPVFQWEDLSIKTREERLRVAFGQHPAPPNGTELPQYDYLDLGQLHSGKLEEGDVIRFCSTSGGAIGVEVTIQHDQRRSGGATLLNSIRSC